MPLKVFGGSLLLPLHIDRYEFDKVPYKKSIEEKISAQLLDQLPDFIVSNYGTFLQFVEAYYEWMEQEKNPRYEGVRVGTYNDIDQTLDEFLQYFKDTYLKDFPSKLADGLNEKTLIKYVTDLYQSKGTKASFDLLFKILFDTNVEVTYPRDKILRVSTSKFIDNKFIRIEPIFSIDESTSVINGIVVQKDPFKGTINATAVIDNIEYLQQSGIDFYRLLVNDISGKFNDQNNIEIRTQVGSTAGSYKAKLLSTLTTLSINAGGTGYEVNDQITVLDEDDRKLLTAKVKSVGPIGEIRSLSYKDNYGIYVDSANLKYTFETYGGTGASFSPLAGEVLADLPDAYEDNTGKLNSNSYIQDNFYFQDFSYVLRVNKTLEQFASTVKKIVHPSGLLMLSEFINETSFTATSIVSLDDVIFLPIIGHYLPHTLGMTIDPRGFTYGNTFTDFYPNGYNGQDGRTFGDFMGITLANATYGTPHTSITAIGLGITHDPTKIYTSAGVALSFDSIETERNLVNGAIGSTGYVGQGTDTLGNYVGLYGFYPIGSDVGSSIDPAYTSITHYGGYVSPVTTTANSGVSAGQIVQVNGTDDSSSDFWIVYRHPAHLGISTLGTTGDRLTIRIPVKPVLGIEELSPTLGSKDGYQPIRGLTITLNAGITYQIGETVVQDRKDEPKAMGEVIDFIPSAYDHNTIFVSGHTDPDTVLDYAAKMYNIGTDTLVVNILNGSFVKSNMAPVVGRSSGASRLIDNTFNPSDIYNGGKYDTSWMDIPIELIVSNIRYNDID